MKAMALLPRLKTSDADEADIAAIEQRCCAAMNDDLNTPVMIAELFEAARIINSVNDGKLKLTAASVEKLRALMRTMVREVLGLRDEATASPTNDNALDALVKEFIRLRAEAKGRKDFATGDAIRDRLAAIGVVLKDTKDGTTWERR